MRPFQIGESDATFNEERRRNWGGAGNYISSGAHGVASGGRRYVGGGNVFTGSGGGSSVGARAVASAGAPYVSHGSVFSGSGGGGGGGGAAAAAAAAHAAAVAAQQARSSAALGVLGIGSGQPGSDPKMAVLQSLMHAGNPFGALAGILGASKGTSLSAITKSAQQGQHDAAKLAQASAAEKQVQKLMSGPGNTNKAAQAVGQVGTTVKLPNLLADTSKGPLAAVGLAAGQAAKPASIANLNAAQAATHNAATKALSAANTTALNKLQGQAAPEFIFHGPFEDAATFKRGASAFNLPNPVQQLQARSTLRNLNEPAVEKSIVKQGQQQIAGGIAAKAQAGSLWNVAHKFYGGNMPGLKIDQSLPFNIPAATAGQLVALGPSALAQALSPIGGAANAPARAKFANTLLHEWTHTRQAPAPDYGSNPKTTAKVEGGAEAYRTHVAKALGITPNPAGSPLYAKWQAQAQTKGPAGYDLARLPSGGASGATSIKPTGLTASGSIPAFDAKAATAVRTSALKALNTAAGNQVVANVKAAQTGPGPTGNLGLDRTRIAAHPGRALMGGAPLVTQLGGPKSGTAQQNLGFSLAVAQKLGANPQTLQALAIAASANPKTLGNKILLGKGRAALEQRIQAVQQFVSKAKGVKASDPVHIAQQASGFGATSRYQKHADYLKPKIGQYLQVAQRIGPTIPKNLVAAGAGQGPAGLSGNLKDLFVAAGKKYGIDPAVLFGIASNETGDKTKGTVFQNPSTSSAGAVGWMQFMPATWAQYGVKAPGGTGTPDPHNVADAVYSAANYLKNGGHYQQGNPAAVRAAIFNYNHSQAYVNDVLNTSKLWRGGAGVAGQSFPSSGASGVSSGVGSAPGSSSSSTSSGTSAGSSAGSAARSVTSQASQAAQAASDQQARALQVASSLLGSTSRNRLAQLEPVRLKLGKIKGKGAPKVPA